MLLSAVLERYETKFLAWRAKLDDLLQAQQAGRKHVSALRNVIPNNPQNLEYFSPSRS